MTDIQNGFHIVRLSHDCQWDNQGKTEYHRPLQVLLHAHKMFNRMVVTKRKVKLFWLNHQIFYLFY
jgi:hypothetical protein